MDSTTIIRIVAGVLVVVILIVLIQRRRTRTKQRGSQTFLAAPQRLA